MYREKEVPKKYTTYDELNKVIKQMDTIFMNSENSKTSDPHSLLLNLSDKVNLKKVINMLLYQTLALTIHGKI